MPLPHTVWTLTFSAFSRTWYKFQTTYINVYSKIYVNKQCNKSYFNKG